MKVVVFERDDNAVLVVPYDLYGQLPGDLGGTLRQLGMGVLDLRCLTDGFVTELGLNGYCIASNEDAEEVLRCISRWKDPEPVLVIEK